MSTTKMPLEIIYKRLNTVHAAADYIAVNVSSPNTPNLRDLQAPENLELLLGELQKRNHATWQQTIARKDRARPDRGRHREPLSILCVRLDVSGIIATNTTIHVAI